MRQDRQKNHHVTLGPYGRAVTYSRRMHLMQTLLCDLFARAPASEGAARPCSQQVDQKARYEETSLRVVGVATKEGS